VAGRICGCVSYESAGAVSYLDGPACQALAIAIVELEAFYAAGEGVFEVDQVAFGAVDQIHGHSGWREIFVVALRDLADLICPGMQATDLPEATAVSDTGVYKPGGISDLYGPAFQAAIAFIELVTGQAAQRSIPEVNILFVLRLKLHRDADISDVLPVALQYLADRVVARQQTAERVPAVAVGRGGIDYSSCLVMEVDGPSGQWFIGALVDFAAVDAQETSVYKVLVSYVIAVEGHLMITALRCCRINRGKRRKPSHRR